MLNKIFFQIYPANRTTNIHIYLTIPFCRWYFCSFYRSWIDFSWPVRPKCII